MAGNTDWSNLVTSQTRSIERLRRLAFAPSCRGASAFLPLAFAIRFRLTLSNVFDPSPARCSTAHSRCRVMGENVDGDEGFRCLPVRSLCSAIPLPCGRPFCTTAESKRALWNALRYGPLQGDVVQDPFRCLPTQTPDFLLDGPFNSFALKIRVIDSAVSRAQRPRAQRLTLYT